MIPLEELILQTDETFAPILLLNFNPENLYPLDLSVNNTELLEIEDLNTENLAAYISGKLRDNGKEIAIGGYGEDRIIYRKSTHFGEGSDVRSIHLGVDVWCMESTLIFAPMDGIVHSFNDNDNFLDYGPTIILEHKLEDQTFYTLYGHLTKDSLSGLHTGALIKKGESFTQVGHVSENGHWPPHLHFQLITNMLDFNGDYPGVCHINEKEKWLNLCPNPMILFNQPI